MGNLSDTEVRSIRQRAIELALEIPINNPQNTASVNTDSILGDAEKIYNWIIKDKEATQP